MGNIYKKRNCDKFIFIRDSARYNLSTGGMAQILYRTGLLKKVNSHELDFLWIYSIKYIKRASIVQHIKNYKDNIGLYLTSRTRLEYRVRRFRRHPRASDYSYATLRVSNTSDYLGRIFSEHKKVFWNGNESMDRNRLFIGSKISGQ